MRRRPTQRKAMTLTEVIVVVAIIGVLIGLTIPAVMKAREAANRTTCQNNMKQLGMALQNFVSAHNRMPGGVERRDVARGDFGPTWAVQLLPYIGADDVASNVQITKPAATPASASASGRNRRTPASSPRQHSMLEGNEATAAQLKQLLCPSDYFGGTFSVTPRGTFSHSNYLAFVGTTGYGVDRQEGAFGSDYGRNYSEFRDGTSHTVTIGEYLTGVPNSEAAHDLRGVFWLDRPGSSQLYGAATPNSRLADQLPKGHCYNQPSRNLPCDIAVEDALDAATTRSRHRGGVNVLLADGSARFINQDINRKAWQALVTVAGGEPNMDEKGQAVAAAPARGKRAQPKGKPTYLRDRYILSFRDGNGIPDAVLAQWSRAGVRVLHRYHEKIRAIDLFIPPDMVDVVKRHPAIKNFEKEQVCYACTQVIPAGIARVGATQSSIRAGKGSGPPVNATIAVFDTGIDSGHPDLNVVRSIGFGFFDGEDGNGHGTHVSGTAAAIDNDIGVVGVAPGARLWALKVLGSTGSGTQGDFLAGISYLTANPKEVEVANMSLGFGVVVPAVDFAVDQLVASGVLVVAAAGNDADDANAHSPAAAGGALTVGAFADSDGRPGGFGPPLPDFDPITGTSVLDPDDSFAPFSNFGEKVSVVAPGVDVLSTFPGGGTGRISGTSMAAPHVAGAVALLMGQQPIHDTNQARLRNVRFNNEPRQQVADTKKRLARAYLGFIIGPTDFFERIIIGPTGYTRRYNVVNVSGF